MKFGIGFLVREHFDEIDAEFCRAEGGSVLRTDGKIQYASVQTTEEIPNRVRLVAHGVAGHASVPLRSNAVAHLEEALHRFVRFNYDVVISLAATPAVDAKK